MKKTFLSFLLLIMVAMNLPSFAFAHTDLETATPAKGEKVTTDLEAVVLTFTTKVESLSTMKLKNEREEIPLQISIEDNQMTGKLNNRLENGNYTVEYKIIGADGHVIEGNYSFSVDRPEQAQPKEEPEEDKDSTEQPMPEQDKKEKPDNPSYFGPLTIGLVLLIAIFSFFAFRRKK
ncbi:copper resistance CopC family protein [Fictibacillus phosphorivorans]|uniref:copper resistance CopC family protein n=1 Tax=Fictibacillus phosphorivorans TaxID=1221500 RepID=UPI00203FD397|nr:copper resistance CopC family protein [Fictibacillus phosphorivorans]MCM3718586.1 copper resistance protein CopC [Fictibacillus phosphorivorans]MCM3776209.1 copper resistance protein CopC [Fictibacillus phosphorivorans]